MIDDTKWSDDKHSNTNSPNRTTNPIITKDGKVIMDSPSDKAEYYYKMAKELFSKGSKYSIILERVVILLYRAIGYVPKCVKYHIFLSNVYLKSLDLTSAIYCLRYVLTIVPEDTKVCKRLAELLGLKGKEYICQAIISDDGIKSIQLYNYALSTFNQSLKYYRNIAIVHVLKAVCILIVDLNYSEALNCVKRAYVCEECDALSPEVIILKAKIYWAMGLVDDGNQEFRSIIRVIPDHPEVLIFAQRTFMKAERLYQLSVTSFTVQQYQQSLSYLNFAINLTADDIKLYMLQSKVYRMMSDLDAAYASIQRATQLYQSASDYDVKLPGDIVRQTNLILNEMGLKYASEGEYLKAIALLSKAIQSENTASKGLYDIDYRFYINRGDFYRALGQEYLNESLSDYKQALRIKPGDWHIRTRLSLSYYSTAVELFNHSEYSECEAQLDDAIDNNDKVARYFALRGQARYLLGKFSEAYSDYRQAQVLDPSIEEVNSRIRQYESNSTPLTTTTATTATTSIASSNAPVSDYNMQSITKVVATSDDVVEMMLNPRRAAELPSVKILRTVTADDKKNKRLSLLNQQQRACDILPKLNPKMAIPLLINDEVHQQCRNVSVLLAAKYSTEKGSNWSMIAQAKESAKRLTKTTRKQVESIKVKKELPISSAALKKLSYKRTKYTLKHNPIVAGIVTNKDDPYLLALSNKPKNILIPSAHVLARNYHSTDDDGGVETFNSEQNAQNVITIGVKGIAKPLDNDLLHRLTTPINNQDSNAAAAATDASGAAYAKLSKKERKALRRKIRKEKLERGEVSDGDADGVSTKKKKHSKRHKKKKGEGEESGSSSSGSSDDDSVDSKNIRDYEQSKLAELLKTAGVDESMDLMGSTGGSYLLMSYEDEMQALYSQLKKDNSDRVDKLSLELAGGTASTSANAATGNMKVNKYDVDDDNGSSSSSSTSDSDCEDDYHDD